MNKHHTEIIFLLDRSGSMSGLERDTVGGFNAFLKNQAELPGEAKVTAVLFDHAYEVLWQGVDAASAELSEREYQVRGTTALLDAVGRAITETGQRLTKIDEAKRPGKVIMVITTDGMENSSREYTYGKVKEMITHQRDVYNWDFIFMGANIDVAKEADSIGISASRAYSFEATEKGVSAMYDQVNEFVMEERVKE